MYVETYCPYCEVVRRKVKELGLQEGVDIEIRDRDKAQHRADLIERGGKPQVPYLVDFETKEEMYESADIAEYLTSNTNSIG